MGWLELGWVVLCGMACDGVVCVRMGCDGVGSCVVVWDGVRWGMIGRYGLWWPEALVYVHSNHGSTQCMCVPSRQNVMGQGLNK